MWNSQAISRRQSLLCLLQVSCEENFLPVNVQRSIDRGHLRPSFDHVATRPALLGTPSSLVAQELLQVFGKLSRKERLYCNDFCESFCKHVQVSLCDVQDISYSQDTVLSIRHKWHKGTYKVSAQAAKVWALGSSCFCY